MCLNKLTNTIDLLTSMPSASHFPTLISLHVTGLLLTYNYIDQIFWELLFHSLSSLFLSYSHSFEVKIWK